mmetsp:Transcript_10589/g.19541  ORF Transcript_10589/g.19541 Transcript_10589/m.19541 type:complete len:361 (+) Transcript_10589:1411-2493(+)
MRDANFGANGFQPCWPCLSSSTSLTNFVSPSFPSVLPGIFFLFFVPRVASPGLPSLIMSKPSPRLLKRSIAADTMQDTLETGTASMHLMSTFSQVNTLSHLPMCQATRSVGACQVGTLPVMENTILARVPPFLPPRRCKRAQTRQKLADLGHSFKHQLRRAALAAVLESSKFLDSSYRTIINICVALDLVVSRSATLESLLPLECLSRMAAKAGETPNATPMIQTSPRSLVKGISWRVVATLTTIWISWMLTGTLELAFKIGPVDFVVKLVVFYLHERFWQLAATRTLSNKRFWKMCLWKVLALSMTTGTAVVMTGSLDVALKLGPADFFVKLFLYYAHEVLWDLIPFGLIPLDENKKEA